VEYLRHNGKNAMSVRYIRASDLKSFAFCKRAWFLEQQGVQSTLASERLKGSADHDQHREAVQVAVATGKTASILLVLGIALALAAFIWGFFR